MRFYSGFQPSAEVTDPDLLFGQQSNNAILPKLLLSLEMGTNIQVVGERRIGKTSMLKCAASIVDKTITGSIAVYMNYRQHHFINGVANGYRFLLASLHDKVNREYNEFDEVDIGGYKFKRGLSLQAIYHELQIIPDPYVEGVLEGYFSVLAEKELGVILFIDEYEHLLLHTFNGQPGAFFFVRDLAARSPKNLKAPKPLTYAIAGSSTWDQLCSKIGSPEMNTVGQIFEIGALDKNDFSAMWGYCIENSSEQIKVLFSNSSVTSTKAFVLTGGWPFFGKLLGHYLAVTMKQDEKMRFNEKHFYETQVRHHFEIIWENLTPIERNILSTIKVEMDIDEFRIRSLERRGLAVIKHGNEVFPRGALWQRFVQKQSQQNIADKSDTITPHIYRVKSLVEDCQSLIYDINENSLNTRRVSIFSPNNEDFITYKTLGIVCQDRDKFGSFARSLYFIIFESTKDYDEKTKNDRRYVPLLKLPKRFRRGHQFVRSVDILRHHFGKSHLTSGQGWNGGNVGDILEIYLGKKTMPVAEEYLKLQLSLLSDMKSYLSELKAFLLA